MSKYMNKTIVVTVLLISSLPLVVCAGGGFNSPNNWDNSPNNWENSSNTWENSPNNWENSPNNYLDDRTIRDSNGDAKGYAVPKADGGINFYDNDGNRTGYLPRPRER